LKLAQISILILVLMAIVCAKSEPQKPANFRLTLYWHSGTLPQPFNYPYTLQIGPGAGGDLTYRTGDNSREWRTEFNLSEQRLNQLYFLLIECDALRSNWETGDPIDGAAWTSIQVQAAGRECHIPGLSELSQSERELVEEIIREIYGSVPAEIWQRMVVRQSQAESGFFEGQ